MIFRAPKILHVITTLERGGIEMWLLSMLARVSRAEYDMDICCKGPRVGSLASVAADLGAAVLHCPLRPTHVGFIRRLGALIRGGHYQIVHNHLETYSGVATWVANRLDVPVITSFHNTRFVPQTWTRLPALRQMRSAYSRVSIRYALNHSTLVTGCSNGVIDAMRQFRPLGSTDLRVLYYGVEIPPLPSRRARREFKESFAWPPDTPVIVHVGRFHAQKNHLGVLAVFQEVLAHEPSAKLFLVGDGPLRPQIEREISSRRLGGSVKLLGTQGNLPALMALCDVFLFPSLHEGLPVAAIEASASGLPIVGTQIPGLGEVVLHGVTGMLHDPRDLRGMARSVVALLRRESAFEGMGHAARIHASKTFTAEAAARRLVHLYDECLSNC